MRHACLSKGKEVGSGICLSKAKKEYKRSKGNVEIQESGHIPSYCTALCATALNAISSRQAPCNVGGMEIANYSYSAGQSKCNLKWSLKL